MNTYSYSRDPGMVKELLQARNDHNKGGVESILVGKPGCGKTTALSQIAIANKAKYGDIILFRSNEDCQWSYLMNADEKMHLLLKKGWKMQLFDRKSGKDVDPETIFEKIKYWTTPVSLVEQKLSHSRMNIVQTTPYNPVDADIQYQFCLDWLNIFMALNRRRNNKAITVLFDEFEDLVPEGAEKQFFKIERSISGIIRKNRKNDISSFVACHALADVHWRIRDKIRWNLYMKGAKQHKDSKIKKNLADLDVGTAMLEGDKFERFTFNSLGDELKLRAHILPDK